MEFKKLEELQIEIIDGDRGKNYPNGDDFKKDKYCLFLNAKNVTINGFNFSETMFIDKDKDTILRKGKLNRDDIVLTTRGTVGNVAYYSRDIIYENVRINSGMVILRCDKNSILPEYLYYVLKSSFLQKQINNIKSGSAQPQLPISTLKNLKINFLNITLQKKVIKILNTIDKKIELNNKINDNLYKVLNMIFQEHFCNKQDDENFERIYLKDLISIRGGLAYKASLLSDNVDDNILVSMGNVELNTIFNFNNLKHYSENVENRYIGEIGDLFICTRDVTQKRNQLGCPGIIPKIFKGKNVIIGTNLYIVDILNNKKNIKYFLYLLMNSNEYRERIVGSAKGTAVLMIAKDDILKYEFCYPKDEKIIDDFNNKVTPIFEKIESIIIENDRLSNLRDALLPKLMNGEIELDKIEI